jgi:SAM-dependent methyltransferase
MMGVVAPPKGVGIDISPGMIEVAKRNNAGHPQYEFQVADVTRFYSPHAFDTILFFDVIEHVADISSSLRSLYDLLAPGGTIVFTMANPLWEPILMVAERWGLKMPEGPHHRIWGGELLRLASLSGLKLAKREWHLIFPKYIPYVSWFLNKVVGTIPLIRRGAVIEVFIFTRA